VFIGGGATPATVLVLDNLLVLCPHQNESNFMALQLITPDDLKNFKEEILSEVRALFQKYSPAPYKRWLKSNEVRKLLKISSGTLQAFRLKGTLKYSKVGGIIYYDQDHVQELLKGKG